MVLLGPTAGSIRELLKVCEDYATSHGLIYNVAKSEYLIFKAPRKQVQYEPIITLKGAVLNRVTQFKYLGHYLTEDLKDHVDKERERRSLAVKCNMLARRFARCSKEVKVTLFKAYCQTFYTGGLWVKYTQRALNTLRVQYNNGFRILLGLPRFCSASGMFAQERIDDFYAIIRKKTASLLTRLRSSSNSILNMLAGKFDSPILQHFMSVLVR
ncbi:jg23407 [Pararge aegeria aegeria]|uniref:Jg23407 protein n=1 Tax=Pararge aegeria aegeria TaxID=348720 RepID=A0A8S4QWC9_9NEOP|nr:jg23407 [Pararge aegeria aegeria]